MTSRLMLLDTASLYFRAFYGVPDTVRAADGTPVNAVRGLLDFISRLTNEYQPQELVCCWDDDWRPQWRVDLIPSYKAHRVERVLPNQPDVEEVPDPLQAQIPIIQAVLAAFGISVIGAADYEADDVIGTLAARASGPVDIVTGDRDLFQTIDDERGVRVLYVARGVARHERVTNQVVMEKYGVPAAQYADFAALRGDASDGLPGVPGVGEKTAAGLLSKHPDIPALLTAALDDASTLASGPRQKLLAAQEYLRVAPEVVRVAHDVPVPQGPYLLPRTPAHPDALVSLAQEWNLESPVARLITTLTDLGNEA